MIFSLGKKPVIFSCDFFSREKNSDFFPQTEYASLAFFESFWAFLGLLRPSKCRKIMKRKCYVNRLTLLGDKSDFFQVFCPHSGWNSIPRFALVLTSLRSDTTWATLCIEFHPFGGKKQNFPQKKQDFPFFFVNRLRKYY